MLLLARYARPAAITEDLIDSVAVFRFILARNARSKNQGYRKQNRDRGKKLFLGYMACNSVELSYSVFHAS